VAADCANVVHPAVPGQWTCVSSLCNWQPTFGPQSYTNLQKYDIPDNDLAGIHSDIGVSNQPSCTYDVSVDLHVDHTYRGDLVVRLTDPRGFDTVLHNRHGGSTDNLDLQGFQVSGLGVDGVNGTWRLDVADHAAWDVGTLTQWTLRLACQ